MHDPTAITDAIEDSPDDQISAVVAREVRSKSGEPRTRASSCGADIRPRHPLPPIPNSVR
jgi:hypothetical protein